MAKSKRRTTRMIVEVSYDPGSGVYFTPSLTPALTAAGARREVRYLIKEGTGYHFSPGDSDGVRLISVRPA